MMKGWYSSGNVQPLPGLVLKGRRPEDACDSRRQQLGTYDGYLGPVAADADDLVNSVEDCRAKQDWPS